jgi:spore maturation protein SpmB
MNKYAPTGNILNDFLNGCRKGMEMALFNQTPNFIMAFVLIQILNVTGIMTVLANVLNPVMGIFGVPGEAGVCLVTAWLSIPGGMAAMVALAAKGVFTGYHVAILIPMMYCMGGQIQYTGRILTVVKTPTKYYFPIYIIGFITAIAIGLIMRMLVGLF